MHTTKRGLIRWHEHFHLTKRLLSCDDTKTTIINSNGTTKYHMLQRNLTRHDESFCRRFRFIPISWIQITTDSSSSGCIQVTAESILRLTQVPAVGYELQLTQSHGWLEFQWLGTSYSWLHPTTDSSYGGSIRLTADSSCGWLRVVADSILRLTPVPAAGLKTWLTYTLMYQVNLRTYFAKCIIFMVCFLPPDFSYHWCRLWILLQEPWRSFKRLGEAWRSLEKDSSATDSNCSGWFELRRLIRTCDQSTTSRILTPIPPDN